MPNFSNLTTYRCFFFSNSHSLTKHLLNNVFLQFRMHQLCTSSEMTIMHPCVNVLNHMIMMMPLDWFCLHYCRVTLLPGDGIKVHVCKFREIPRKHKVKWLLKCRVVEGTDQIATQCDYVKLKEEARKQTTGCNFSNVNVLSFFNWESITWLWLKCLTCT